jgi:hypothetical protein
MGRAQRAAKKHQLIQDRFSDANLTNLWVGARNAVCRPILNRLTRGWVASVRRKWLRCADRLCYHYPRRLAGSIEHETPDGHTVRERPAFDLYGRLGWTSWRCRPR